MSPWDLTEHEEEEKILDSRTLYFLLPEDDADDKLERIRKILKAHPGENKVKFQYKKQIYELETKVNNLEQVGKEIAGILGPQAIKIF